MLIVAPSGKANDVVLLDTCNSFIVVLILSGNVAIEEAVENAKSCTFHIALKKFLYVVHLEKSATDPPIITYVIIASTMIYSRIRYKILTRTSYPKLPVASAIRQNTPIGAMYMIAIIIFRKASVQ